MSRIRSIKPEWLDDELLAAASDEARALSVGLILMADDYGNGRASIATIAASVWRYQLERNDGENAPEVLAKASRAFRELVAIRFVGCWTDSGQRYYAIRNWARHQRVDKPGKPLVHSVPPELFDGINIDQKEDSRGPREQSTEPSSETRLIAAPDRKGVEGSREEGSGVAPQAAAPTPAPKTKRERGWRRFPPDFKPTQKHVALAAELGVDLRLEYAKILDHEFARTRTDADAALSNWIRGARPTLSPQQSPRQDPAIAARLAAVEAARAAEREAHHRALAAELPDGSTPPANVRSLLGGIGGGR